MMNGNGPLTYDGNLPISLTLPLGQWQQVMQVLIDTPLPWKLVNPLVVALDKQIQEELVKLPTVGSPREQPSA